VEKALLAKLLLQEDNYPHPLCRVLRVLVWIMRSFIAIVGGYPYPTPLLYSLTVLYAVLTPLLGPVFDLVPVLVAYLAQDLLSAAFVMGGYVALAVVELGIASEEECQALYEPLYLLYKRLIGSSALLSYLIEGKADSC
jgi:hypothetical protein